MTRFDPAQAPTFKLAATLTIPLALTLAAALTLSACSTPPPASPVASATATRDAALSKAGFVLGDEGWSLSLADSLTFDFASASVTPTAQLNIMRLADVLRDVGVDALRIEGHTDDIGQPQANQRLSLRRAQAVADVFSGAGFNPAKLSVAGLGASRPAANNASEEGRAANRRVAVIVPVP